MLLIGESIMTCCFFGHRDTPDKTKTALRSLLVNLIEDKQIDRFLVGNNGNFDHMVISVLFELKMKYTNLQCFVVLYNLSESKQISCPLETIYPEGLELAPPRFAIDRRNRWMLLQSDLVVGYVFRSVGGAAHFFNLAQKQGKQTYNLFV